MEITLSRIVIDVKLPQLANEKPPMDSTLLEMVTDFKLPQFANA